MTVQPLPFVDAHASHVRLVTAGAALFWVLAAAAISLGEALPQMVMIWARAGVIGVASGVAGRLLVRDGDIDKTIAIGALWLALSIGAEVAMTAASGQPWDLLLGSVAHPVARALTIVAWLIAPSLFARCDRRGGPAC